MFLRQSTASQEIALGYFLDPADGNTEETSLTINNTDIKLWKNGATALVDKNSGGATHMANGLYSAVLDATDTNTLGNLEIFVHVAGALVARREYVVLPALVYDALIAGSVNLPVNALQVEGGDATDAIASSVWNAAARTLTSGVNIVLAKGVGITGFNDISAADVRTEMDNASADLNTIVSGIASILSAISAVQADTDNIQTRLPAALIGGRIDANVGAINASATAAVLLALSAGTMVSGAAQAGTLSTTEMTTNLTEATNDHYNGRLLVWTSGSLFAQYTSITDYDGATKKLTYIATTEAPLAGDTFIIV